MSKLESIMWVHSYKSHLNKIMDLYFTYLRLAEASVLVLEEVLVEVLVYTLGSG